MKAIQPSGVDGEHLGRPGRRGAKSIPNWSAVACCHASLPKGRPFRRDCRNACISASVCGSLT